MKLSPCAIKETGNEIEIGEPTGFIGDDVFYGLLDLHEIPAPMIISTLIR